MNQQAHSAQKHTMDCFIAARRYDMSWRQLKDIDPMAYKLARAKQFLGSDWVLHPEYQFRARHSPDTEVWHPNRVLADIELKAKIVGRI